MIEYKRGNLLDDDAEALVNTVNCVGIMGKGIALQFKQAFPDNFRAYEKACRKEEVKPGKMFIFDTGNLFNRKYIINFPTKRHWRGKTRIQDIDQGLEELVNVIKKFEIKSIAIPPLGCGNGGLSWTVVKPKIEKYFQHLPDVKVNLYEPAGSPDNDKMNINTKKPKMTRSRALFIALMELYAIPGYQLSLLEIQKLAYFLQEKGEPLRLNFVKGIYGPYAENLNFVLQRLEGHYIRGYGDRSRDAQIRVLPNAYSEIENYLKDEPDANQRLNDVSSIIYGYETPYGLELLSTIHWIAKNARGMETDLDTIITEVQNWNDRKKKLFKQEHIKKAWNHLQTSANMFN